MAINLAGKKFTLENQDIDESSGLAVSSRYDNLLWTHNDSGNHAIIYGLDFKGKDLGTFFMGGDYPRDWEDISSFKLHGESYLLLADTGDNAEINYTARLVIFKEPDIYHAQQQVMQAQWLIEFQYPKGKSYDVESVAVDSVQNKIILLSKRNKKVHVFELPLKLEGGMEEGQLLTAKRVTKLNYFKRPTAMDISHDGKQAAILTYGVVYLYENPKHENWGDIFKNPAIEIHYKRLHQPEGVSFDQNKKYLFISSEKLPAKLLRLKLKKYLSNE